MRITPEAPGPLRALATTPATRSSIARALHSGADVAFFLTPKDQLTWVHAGQTVEQALECIRGSRYTAVPLLDADGGYVGTLTEGDILFHLLEIGEAWRSVTRYSSVLTVARHSDNRPVHADAVMETLVARAIDQNFVPVVDDRDVLIGIAPRKPILEYCARVAGLLEFPRATPPR